MFQSTTSHSSSRKSGDARPRMKNWGFNNICVVEESKYSHTYNGTIDNIYSSASILSLNCLADSTSTGKIKIPLIYCTLKALIPLPIRIIARASWGLISESVYDAVRTCSPLLI